MAAKLPTPQEISVIHTKIKKQQLQQSPHFRVSPGFRVPKFRLCPSCNSLNSADSVTEGQEAKDVCKYCHHCIKCKIAFCYYCLTIGHNCGDAWSKDTCKNKAPTQTVQ
mmetsp:Transcript_9980/g.17083  ORF Transcript_9980/g.17083 Transcript_9980/m.17083 type:complete len:109 (+) Transcript_9980:44-370(+)